MSHTAYVCYFHIYNILNRLALTCEYILSLVTLVEYLKTKWRDVRHGHALHDPLFWFVFSLFILAMIVMMVLIFLGMFKLCQYYCLREENIIE